MKNKKVALVLSGGGALGIAHLGVIEVLEKNNIPIDIITGTSMGALVGGLYAAGVSVDTLKKKLLSFRRMHIIDIDIFALLNNGLLKGKKVTKYIEKIVFDKKIEDCKKTFGCVATDLEKGELVNMISGQLSLAIRSSIAVPGLFAPAENFDKELYDGGLIDNLPINLAKQLGADIIIAVDVTKYKVESQLNRPFNIITSAFRLMLDKSIEGQRKMADVLINVYQPDVDSFSFSKENNIKSYEYGKKACEDSIKKIKQLLIQEKVIANQKRAH